MKGQVAALVGPQQIAIKEFDLPEPEAGTVLIKISRANVCGSEVHVWHWHHPVIKEAVLGHEFIGEIVALGQGVNADYAGAPVAVGDRVVAPYYLTCRRCPACLHGDWNLCQRAYAFWSQPPETPPHFTGAFASHYVIQRDQHFYRVPDGLPDAAVCGANCGLAQVMFGLTQVGLTAGETVAIQGAGGLGLYAAAVAKDLGAHVIQIEPIPSRLELSRQFGSDERVDRGAFGPAEELASHVASLTGGFGADVVLEVTGVPSAFTEALHIVRPGGRVVEIGNVNLGPGHEAMVPPGLITRKGITVRGFVRYHPAMLHRALAFLERKHERHPFDRLSDREYSLDEVDEAIRRTESKQVARPAVVPS
jgi:threonine dehydrogenase-like Zn-dependent dehydrogenase